MIELPNPLKSVRHSSYSKGRLVELVTLLNISILHNYEAKITSIEGRLKGYSKPPLLGIKLLTPV